jgi:hypothetical protein
MPSGDHEQLPWLQALLPVRPASLEQLSNHSPLKVWHVDVEFKTWVVPDEIAQRWADSKTNNDETWRKRPLTVTDDSTCAYACGEVEIARRLRRAGFQAYWISEWSGFPHVEHWREFCVKRSELRKHLPQVWSFDQRVRAAAADLGVALGGSGGHPDVVAWEPGSSDYVFLEYKGPNDAIREKQNQWANVMVEMASPRLAYLAVRGHFL